nr:hypothetical protein [Hypnea sp.]
MLIYYTLKYYWLHTNKANFISNLFINKYNLSNINSFTAMIKPLDIFGKSLKNKNHNDFYENMKIIANKKLVSRNFMIKLLNTYWQETIFVSKSSSLSNEYINQLKSDGLAIYKNQYKKFLSDFSRALVVGRIEVSLSNNDKYNETNCYTENEIKYIWKKGLNCLWSKYLFSFLSKYSKLTKLNHKKLDLIRKLQSNNFPLFTVVNNSHQIIIAEPSDELIYNKSLLDKLYQWYYNSFLIENINKPLYEGLFFINPQDALEYKKHIEYKHKTICKKQVLNILTCNLSFYYKLFYKLPLKIQLHLIPDLKEVGELINKYQYYHNVSFHEGQIYNRYSFQGQPIYLIQSLMIKNKHDKKMEIVRYDYSSGEKSQVKSYEYIFLNYDMALLAWQKFIKQNIEYKLPQKPNILVYNLEDFLNKYSDKQRTNSYVNNFIFIPSEESYNFLKVNSSLASEKMTYDYFINILIAVKVLINRIVWSLTSKQPVNL